MKCPICKWMAGGPGKDFNTEKEMSFHLLRHPKESLIYLITEDLLKMGEER